MPIDFPNSPTTNQTFTAGGGSMAGGNGGSGIIIVKEIY